MPFIFGLVSTFQHIRAWRERCASYGAARISSKPDEVKVINGLIDLAEKQFSDFELDAALDRISRIRSSVKADCSFDSFSEELGVLAEVAEDQLHRRHAVYIPLKKYDYYWEVDTLFPNDLVHAFPTAGMDIIDACWCYALNLNTACVYHAMGIVQCGLHALARELKIPFSATLELENWKNIIDQIEKEIRKLEQLPKSHDKDEKVSFYSNAALQFRYFKDAWRNHVDHNRERYEADQAHSILIHARDFLKHLAEGGLRETV